MTVPKRAFAGGKTTHNLGLDNKGETMRYRVLIVALLLSLAVLPASAQLRSVTSYGKAWFDGQGGRFGYVDYWLGWDVQAGHVYLSKFVFRQTDGVGSPANLQFVASRWATVLVDPVRRVFALLVYGAWNGTPAYGYFVLHEGAYGGQDRIEFSVSKMGYGVPMYSIAGITVAGDCKLILSQ
ncbi:MAG: hypothetical protein AMXMBFR61_08530 [Fimbriimonadales bacterium]